MLSEMLLSAGLEEEASIHEGVSSSTFPLTQWCGLIPATLGRQVWGATRVALYSTVSLHCCIFSGMACVCVHMLRWPMHATNRAGLLRYL